MAMAQKWLPCMRGWILKNISNGLDANVQKLLEANKNQRFFIFLMPFVDLIFDAIYDQLGANPIETLHFTLGDWALRFLCLGLAVTPVRKIFKQNWLSRFRRMIGLYAFFMPVCIFWFLLFWTCHSPGRHCLMKFPKVLTS